MVLKNTSIEAVAMLGDEFLKTITVFATARKPPDIPIFNVILQLNPFAPGYGARCNSVADQPVQCVWG